MQEQGKEKGRLFANCELQLIKINVKINHHVVSLKKKKTLDQEEAHSTPLRLHVDHKMDQITIMAYPIIDVETCNQGMTFILIFVKIVLIMR